MTNEEALERARALIEDALSDCIIVGGQAMSKKVLESAAFDLAACYLAFFGWWARVPYSVERSMEDHLAKITLNWTPPLDLKFIRVEVKVQT